MNTNFVRRLTPASVALLSALVGSPHVLAQSASDANAVAAQSALLQPLDVLLVLPEGASGEFNVTVPPDYASSDSMIDAEYVNRYLRWEVLEDGDAAGPLLRVRSEMAFGEPVLELRVSEARGPGEIGRYAILLEPARIATRAPARIRALASSEAGNPVHGMGASKKRNEGDSYGMGASRKRADGKEGVFGMGASKKRESDKDDAFAMGASKKRKSAKDGPFAMGASKKRESDKDDAFAMGASKKRESDKDDAFAMGASKKRQSDKDDAFAMGASKKRQSDKDDAFAMGASKKRESDKDDAFAMGASKKRESGSAYGDAAAKSAGEAGMESSRKTE
ncbi:MAG: hypothetical protein AAF458_06020 [Pseudomonadota bacterium]